MQTVTVTDSIDRSPISLFQWKVIGLCSLLALIDGFDTQAIGFVAKLVGKEFNIASTEMGAIFAAGLLGLMCGAFALSPVSDRFGRKPVIIFSCVVMGCFSLLTATASSANELMFYRFLTGIGLGGVMPNINTLTSEYAPGRHRATLMTLMFLGFPLGAAVGGVLSTYLIATFGWPSVFIFGGIIPLLLSVVLVFFLPESICFLTTKRAGDVRIGKYLKKIDRALRGDADYTYRLPPQPQKGSISLLFSKECRRATLLLWAVFFCNLLMMYTLLNWLPTVMQEAGLSLKDAILTTVAFNGGGVVGGLGIARLIDRFSALRTMLYVYLVTAFFIVLLGFSTGSIVMALGVAACAGFCVVGGQLGVNAYTVGLYPTNARSTGLGWALAIGRIGSVVGPLVLGGMKALGWPIEGMFALIAIPALLCFFLVLALKNTTIPKS